MTVLCSSVIAPGHVHLGQRFGDKAALLRTLAGTVAAEAGCKAATLAEAILKREALGSTGVGDGVALPHARLKALSAARAAVAVLAQPLDFDAIDDAPVDIVVLLALPEAPASAALQILSGLARGLRRPEIRAALRDARDPAAAHAVLCGMSASAP